MAFGCKQLSGHVLLSRYQKAGVHAAYSPSASQRACSARREINPQKPAFGCKQLSGCIHGTPPHTPPKGTFCKKSPLESRKTAFDFYCLVFHRLLSRYQKTGVHADYSPSASQRACSARCEFNPQNRHRRFASCLFSMKRVSLAKASLRLQAAVGLVFATKVSKITVHAAYSPSASQCA